jgi:hypothetical protein
VNPVVSVSRHAQVFRATLGDGFLEQIAPRVIAVAVAQYLVLLFTVAAEQSVPAFWAETSRFSAS